MTQLFFVGIPDGMHHERPPVNAADDVTTAMEVSTGFPPVPNHVDLHFTSEQELEFWSAPSLHSFQSSVMSHQPASQELPSALQSQSSVNTVAEFISSPIMAPSTQKRLASALRVSRKTTTYATSR